MSNEGFEEPSLSGYRTRNKGHHEQGNVRRPFLHFCCYPSSGPRAVPVTELQQPEQRKECSFYGMVVFKLRYIGREMGMKLAYENN